MANTGNVDFGDIGVGWHTQELGLATDFSNVMVSAVGRPLNVAISVHPASSLVGDFSLYYPFQKFAQDAIKKGGLQFSNPFLVLKFISANRSADLEFNTYSRLFRWIVPVGKRRNDILVKNEDYNLILLIVYQIQFSQLVHGNRCSWQRNDDNWRSLFNQEYFARIHSPFKYMASPIWKVGGKKKNKKKQKDFQYSFKMESGD